MTKDKTAWQWVCPVFKRKQPMHWRGSPRPQGVWARVRFAGLEAVTGRHAMVGQGYILDLIQKHQGVKKSGAESRAGLSGWIHCFWGSRAFIGTGKFVLLVWNPGRSGCVWGLEIRVRTSHLERSCSRRQVREAVREAQAGVMGSVTDGCRVLVCDDQVLEMGSAHGCTTMRMSLVLLSCPQKNGFSGKLCHMWYFCFYTRIKRF